MIRWFLNYSYSKLYCHEVEYLEKKLTDIHKIYNSFLLRNVLVSNTEKVLEYTFYLSLTFVLPFSLPSYLSLFHALSFFKLRFYRRSLFNIDHSFPLLQFRNIRQDP